MKLQLGKECIVNGELGTVWQIRRFKVQVLFPIRKFSWFPREMVKAHRPLYRRR